MDSNDEMEVISTYFEAEDDTNDDLLEIDMVNQKAKMIEEEIMKLKTELRNILKNCKDAETKEKEVSRINKLLAEMKHEYEAAVERLSELAKIVDFQVDNLEYRKLGIDQLFSVDADSTVVADYVDETPWIVVRDSKEPKLFNYEQINYESIIDNDESFCTCDGDSEEYVCTDSSKNLSIEDFCEVSEKLDTDYEKEAVRDDLMVTIGEVKLLHEQNRDLLSQLNATKQRTTVLSNALRNKPYNTKSQNNIMKTTVDFGNTETKSAAQDLRDEVNRLRNELDEMKRDQCQIELARKILNISDSKCANCLGSTNANDNDKIKLEELTEKFNCLLADRDNDSKEIEDLRKKLNAEIHDSKEYKDCLVISKTRITQLETELFDIKSAKSHDTGVAHSNDKYLIENLKHRLFEAKAEINNMDMVLDFHLSELEDKKAKYLAVLQTYHEQKNRIETLNNEKRKIANEYEDEFKRMDAHVKTRLEEIGTLPAKLELAQCDFEKEKSARIALEEERNTLLNEIESLKASLAHENHVGNDKTIKDLEEQKNQLTATVMNLKDSLKENSRLYIERSHYALQLKDHLNTVREEAAIQVTKIKDFFECQKLKHTVYIQQLEKQLAESRAIACSEFKKHDHINERLRHRIEILTKNLNEANLKITEVVNVKKLIENNSREEFCRIPQIFNSISDN